MLLSIVMPVYNSEKFLKQCLDSIVFQLSVNTEIIIVDDSSIDNSKAILYDYLEKIDPEKKILIKIISLEENKGVGYARMLAISNASGKYICSIDPDDIVSNNYIYDITSILKKYDPDVLQFHISRFTENIEDRYILSSNFLIEGLHEINGKLKKDFYEQNFWSFCTRVIKRNLFDNVNFSNLRNCEDVYALPLIIAKINNIYILDKDLYYYRLNLESLSKSSKNIANAKKSYKYILDVYEEKLKEDTDLYYAFIPILRGYIEFCLKYTGYKNSCDELNYYKKKIRYFPYNIRFFSKLSHNLFILFGVKFLLIFGLIRGKK